MSHTVLVVEDDVIMAQVVSQILEDEGYRVLWAARADMALSMLQDTCPDLILSDIMMPGMSGFTFCQRVRAESRWQQIPFVFLTGKGERVDVRLGMGLGADDYLIKPFEPEDLLIAVQTRLQRVAELQGRGGQVEADHGVTHLPTPGDNGQASQTDPDSARRTQRAAQARREVRCRRLPGRLACGSERPLYPGRKVGPVGELVADVWALARGTDR
jgi:DNA-binding response OmpR family regulator